MKNLVSIFFLVLALFACQPTQKKGPAKTDAPEGKFVVYQVFTRLFGNTYTTNKPWGTIEENGVGKFSDFTDRALDEIKSMGVTHIWYTGVPHHDVITDYTEYGISNDDPDVVKGRAGSPYAVKDYYNVNPDLAVDPANRLQEFEALIERTHNHGMKVIIDIVPNHVARNYQSISKPEGFSDFGENDDTSVEYIRDNNFYYIPDEAFQVPEFLNGYQPLGGDPNPLSDGNFDENPAKWTGNGARLAQPGFYDWYETVKVNYGVKPDGTYDFDLLPEGFDREDYEAHFEFWQDKDVPDSWTKFRDIAIYWLEKGVDGFRYDMAEMVPVEFWSYMNSAIKMKNPDAFLLAEVYNPALYRDYIQKGKMDYLYDKVELYDTLKHIMQGHGSTDNLPAIYDGLKDIEHHMLHFLENHDEQRIASAGFAGSAERGKPAMVVSTCLSTSPTMIYFGQNVGEPGDGDMGFGDETRTSIFDYCGVPAHQRWMNNGKFDGGQSTDAEKELNAFYKNLLSFSAKSSALMGEYKEIHSYNRHNTEGYTDKIFSFVRWKGDNRLIVVSNFEEVPYKFQLKLDEETVKSLHLTDGLYKLTDQLASEDEFVLEVKNGKGEVELALAGLESFIFKMDVLSDVSE
ncbi:alpha-amylase family protein [Draconibacterium sp. IB214405]|uniref:alpha-amylase family protein n=1 Tax=Draconibacterium sp. IB214405 TaxID=3097352 RepID=UPI002A0FB24B|nr:alpha-amylase family protein [Draconibacterium sp. IB214405]MDX8337967.1 alpha-amylase family protein [Draconibacterium sp. IB214405]